MPTYLFNQFTPREREVLEALCMGLSTKEIALRLDLSLATVRSLIRTLLTKTGTRDQNSLLLHVITRDRRVHYLDGRSASET
jgi:DNA-binding NarL/FixJ family response regulator